VHGLRKLYHSDKIRAWVHYTAGIGNRRLPGSLSQVLFCLIHRSYVGPLEARRNMRSTPIRTGPRSVARAAFCLGFFALAPLAMGAKLVDDFEDDNQTNALGGAWHSIADATSILRPATGFRSRIRGRGELRLQAQHSRRHTHSSPACRLHSTRAPTRA
jgi:hypothetical protein